MRGDRAACGHLLEESNAGYRAVWEKASTIDEARARLQGSAPQLECSASSSHDGLGLLGASLFSDPAGPLTPLPSSVPSTPDLPTQPGSVTSSPAFFQQHVKQGDGVHLNVKKEPGLPVNANVHLAAAPLPIPLPPRPAAPAAPTPEDLIPPSQPRAGLDGDSEDEEELVKLPVKVTRLVEKAKSALEKHAASFANESIWDNKLRRRPVIQTVRMLTVPISRTTTNRTQNNNTIRHDST